MQHHQPLSVDYIEAAEIKKRQKEDRKIYQAMEILESRMKTTGDSLNDSANVKRFLSLRLRSLEQECFCAVLLNTQHQFIHFEDIALGTIDAAHVYPREVVKLVLKHNAAAVIFAHNHPSGVPEPSSADIQITKRLKEALELIDVRTLDHFVVGNSEIVSFAERGLL